MAKSTAYEFEARRNSDGEFVCETFSQFDVVDENVVDTTEPSGAAEVASEQPQQHQQYQQQHQHQQQRQYQYEYRKDGPQYQYYQHDTPFDSNMADEIFKQSYESNFVSGSVEYVDQMRNEFDQMRQTMLDQMESFTYIKNIRK